MGAGARRLALVVKGDGDGVTVAGEAALTRPAASFGRYVMSLAKPACGVIKLACDLRRHFERCANCMAMRQLLALIAA